MAKNIVVEAPGPKIPLRVAERPIPTAPAKGVVIRIHCAGICHTDVHIWNDKVKISEDKILTMQQVNPKFKWPFIFGHEIAGEISEVGAQTTGLSVGDRVVACPYVGCGNCPVCHHRENNLCKESLVYDIGIGVDGGYQCYLAINDYRNIVKISPSMPTDVACMFSCSALTAYNAVRRAKGAVERAHNITGEARFMVVGAGGLGLWAVQMAKAMYPSNTKVFVADVDEDKLKLAREHGADGTVYWQRGAGDEEMIQKTKQITGGIDGSADFVGNSSTILRCFGSTNKGATLVMIGLAGGLANVPLVDLILREITISGIYVGTRQNIADMVELYNEKKMKPPPLIHVQPEQAADTLVDLRDGKVLGRAVIHFI